MKKLYLIILKLKTKFNYIKHHHLKRYIDSSLLFGHWIEPEWEFPKGRKNYKESDYECAIRETTEETGYPNHLFTHLNNNNNNNNNIIFDEVFVGSNNKKYKHSYFVMSIDYTESLIQREYDVCEVSSITWQTYNDCNEIIRYYNIEKKKVLAKINNYILQQ